MWENGPGRMGFRDSQYGTKGQTVSMGYKDRQSVWD